MTPGATSQFDPALMGIGSIGQLLLSAVSRYPDQPAVADDRHAWTYTQFADVVARAISVLKAIGLCKGDGFAMLLSNRAEQLACQYAAVLIGARYTALHPLASHETHLFVLKDAEIKVLLTEPEFLARLKTGFRDGSSALQHVLSLGPATGAVDFLALLSSATPTPLVDEADPEDVAFLFYTGGTTGVPKGVMLPHRSIVTAALVQAVDWDLPAGAMRFLAATPTSHASGVIVPTVFLKGGLVRVTPGFEPDSFCRLVESEKINFTFLVPTMLYVLLDHPASRDFDLSSLETVVYGAAPMSADRLGAAIERFGPIFVQLYGQTEAPMVITALRKVDHDPARPERLASCGLPCSSVQVKLFDPQMREVDVGESGEICVRGPLVMGGYWNRPEETSEAFRGGWLHTGDVAKCSADGFLTIVDRTKDMIISGGFNVYPREVEDALLAHSEVSMAAVIGVPDPKWGEAVTAFVVLRHGATVDAPSLKAHVRELRGPIWMPKEIHFVAELPVTALGKVDRRAIRARHAGLQPS
jgi:fatty-acyl-CoA synthase